jgi:hypothetical protein
MACSQQLYAEGKASPRTCQDCGLGPCKLSPKQSIPKPETLRQQFLTRQDGIVQKSIREVSEYLIREYRPGKSLHPPMPADKEAADAVANAFRIEGWTVKYSFSQKDGADWAFSDVPDAEAYYNK